MTPKLRLSPNNPVLLKLHQVRESHDFYIVGGFVRDLYLGLNPVDIDLSAHTITDSFIDAIKKAFHIVTVKRSQFGTLTLKSRGKIAINIAKMRREVYTRPGALPDVQFVNDLKKDAKRRDFTINSLYLDPSTFEIIDPLSGLSDLELRILKVNYKGSFSDDPTRAFRAIRYKNRLHFSYHKSTLLEFENAKKWLKNVSFDRIKNELKRIVISKNRLGVLNELVHLQLLCSYSEIFCAPSQGYLPLIHKAFQYDESSYLYFLGTMAKPQDLLSNFNFTRDEKRKLSELGSIFKYGKGLGPEEVVKKFYSFSKKSLIAGGIITGNRYIKKLALLKRPPVDAALMLKNGIEGKTLKNKYQAILSMQLEGKLKTKAEIERYIKNL